MFVVGKNALLGYTYTKGRLLSNMRLKLGKKHRSKSSNLPFLLIRTSFHPKTKPSLVMTAIRMCCHDNKLNPFSRGTINVDLYSLQS